MTEASKRLEMLERVIAAGSDDPFHWYGRAMELRSLGRGEEALQAFTEVRERFPEYVPTFLMAGQLCQELGRTQDAERWLNEGIELARQKGDQHTLGELRAELEQLRS